MQQLVIMRATLYYFLWTGLVVPLWSYDSTSERSAKTLKVRDGVLPARVFVMGRLQDGFFFFFLSTLSVPRLTL